MTYGKPLVDRERALEDLFFRKETERLLDAMRSKKSREAQMKALSDALGISRTDIIEPLVDLGICESNVSALVVAPLVAVGWADGMLDNEEHRLIVKSEIALGIDPESEGGKLVDVWLAHRPHVSLLDTWAKYVSELCDVLSEETCKQLRDDIVSRANRIAKAIEKSFLRGGGPTRAEQAALDKIEAAFARLSSD